MERYEYKSIKLGFRYHKKMDVLTDLGEVGWDLFQVVNESQQGMCLLKRRFFRCDDCNTRTYTQSESCGNCGAPM